MLLEERTSTSHRDEEALKFVVYTEYRQRQVESPPLSIN